MPIYRLAIEHGDTLWITAHDERGAIELASAHVAGEALEHAAAVQLTHDADETVILRATTNQWLAAAQDRGIDDRAVRASATADA